MFGLRILLSKPGFFAPQTPLWMTQGVGLGPERDEDRDSSLRGLRSEWHKEGLCSEWHREGLRSEGQGEMLARVCRFVTLFFVSFRAAAAKNPGSFLECSLTPTQRSTLAPVDSNKRSRAMRNQRQPRGLGKSAPLLLRTCNQPAPWA